MSTDSQVTVKLLPDMATVGLYGEIEDGLIIECAGVIEQLIEEYYYDKIQLEISSPGGQVSSLNYFLGQTRKWKGKAELTTRSLTRVSSAAALLLSLGDERRAEEDSILLYHEIRQILPAGSPQTARKAQEDARKIQPMDHDMVDRLVERARRISIADWRAYLDKASKRENKANMDEEDEHKLCAKLFNLPADRQLRVKFSTIFHDYTWGWLTVPVPFASTGTGDKLESQSVLSMEEVWHYVCGERLPRSYKDSYQVLNAIAASAFKEIADAGREKPDTATDIDAQLKKELQAFFFAIDKEQADPWQEFENTEAEADGAVTVEGAHGYSTDSSIEFGGISPAWKVEKLMAEILRKHEDDTSENKKEDSINCVALKDRLRALYRNLLAMDVKITPRIAKALGLIDAIGNEDPLGRRDERQTEAQCEADWSERLGSGDDYGKTLPVYEWRALYPDGVPWEYLCRHCMILGETGSGKSKSGILPIVKAIVEQARHADQKKDKPRVGCLLVIDPKQEIVNYLASWFEKAENKAEKMENIRLRKLETKPPGFCLNLMAHEDLPGNRESKSYYIDRAKAVFRMTASLIPQHAASVLLNRNRGGENNFWDQQGTSYASAMVAAMMMLSDFLDDEDGEKKDIRLKALRYYCRTNVSVNENQLEMLMDLVEESLEHKNILHSSQRLFMIFGGNEGRETLMGVVQRIESLIERLPKRVKQLAKKAEELADKAEELAEVEEELAKKAEELAALPTANSVRGILEALQQFASSFSGDNDRYVGSVMASVHNCFFQIADDDAAESLFFGVEPGKRERELNFAEAVRPGKDVLDIFIYSPDMARSSAELVGRSLKANYFAAVLNDPDRKNFDRQAGNSGHAESYAGYIADEFHRFITDDMHHGEQSFLDTCRSFGGFCLLACQAVESMRHALLSIGSDRDKVDSAIGILLNNTATKLFFRATDIATTDRLAPVMPRGKFGDVLLSRPLSSLKPGEGYAVLADSRVVRRQLDYVRDNQPR